MSSLDSSTGMTASQDSSYRVGEAMAASHGSSTGSLGVVVTSHGNSTGSPGQWAGRDPLCISSIHRGRVRE